MALQMLALLHLEGYSHHEEALPIAAVSLVATLAVNHQLRTERQNVSHKFPTTLDHHTFFAGEWKCGRLRDHPRVPITITIAASPKKMVV